MGQAKRRGNYEWRVEQAQLVDQIIEKAFGHEPQIAKAIMWSKFHGDKKAFAKEIMNRQSGKDLYREWPIVTKLSDPLQYAAERGNEFSPCFKTRLEVERWIDERKNASLDQKPEISDNSDD